MTPEEIELAKRLAACEQWDWDEEPVDGICAISPDGAEEDMIDAGIIQPDRTGWYPNLYHWATVGCLLGMVTEAIQAGCRNSGCELELHFFKNESVDPWYVFPENTCDCNGRVRPDNQSGHLGPALARLLLEVWEDHVE